MKKAFFLILFAFIFACFMPAQDTGDDQWEPQELDLWSALSGNGAEFRAVTPDSAGFSFVTELQYFTGVPFTAGFAVFKEFPEKYLQWEILDDIGSDIKTGLIKEALTLRGA